MPLEADDGLTARFNRAARLLEERIGHWPAWLKFVVFAPILFLLTGLVFVLLHGFTTGLRAIVHH